MPLPIVVWPRSESPGSDAGRGLKLVEVQQRRNCPQESPGSDAGRGLKHSPHHLLFEAFDESPGSDAGRGLKPDPAQVVTVVLVSRPAAMPGVD